MTSMAPMATVNASNEEVPVDLTLEPGAGGFAPIASTMTFSFPLRLDDGINLGPAGRMGVDADAAGSSTGQLIAGDSEVFYPNVTTDTDVVTQPTPTGLEQLTQLRSPASPSTVTLDLSLSAGASVQLENGTVLITRGSENLASILPPGAVDAQGRTVPVSMTLAGTTITLHVDTSGEVAWPVLVDPNVIEGDVSPNMWKNCQTATPAMSPGACGRLPEMNSWSSGAYLATNGTYSVPTYATYPWAAVRGEGNPGIIGTPKWANTVSSSYPYGRAFQGLYLYAYPNVAYAAGSYAEWYWRVPNWTGPGTTTAFISRFDTAYQDLSWDNKTTGDNAWIIDGLANSRNLQWTGALTYDQQPVHGDYKTVFPYTDPAHIAASDTAIFMLYFPGPGTVTPSGFTTAYLGGAILTLSDPETPRSPPVCRRPRTGGPTRARRSRSPRPSMTVDSASRLQASSSIKRQAAT